MSLRGIIDVAIDAKATTKTGAIASPFYQYFDTRGNWVWACDVDLGGENNIMKCVPVASNNRELIYAEQGKAVTLARMNNGKWVITGLSKVKNTTVHYIYLSFADDMFAISRTELRGIIIRPLTYGEMGTLVAPYGYGILPYGAQGKFQADGTFIEIVEWL